MWRQQHGGGGDGGGGKRHWQGHGQGHVYDVIADESGRLPGPAATAAAAAQDRERRVPIALAATLLGFAFFVLFSMDLLSTKEGHSAVRDISSSSSASTPSASSTSSVVGLGDVSTSTSPNVVLLLIDDAGWNDLTEASTDLAGLTPNLASIATQSVHLSNYYSQAVCTPARAALMTGKYPIHTGMQSGVITMTYPYGLPLEHQTLAQTIKAASAGADGTGTEYKTALLGKWHLGHYAKAFLPLQRGFDVFHGILGGYANPFTLESEEYDLPTITDKTFYDGYLNEAVDTELLSRQDMYNTGAYTMRARTLLTEYAESGSPFFLYYALPNMHAPLDAPESTESSAQAPFVDRLESMGYSTRRQFAQSTLEMDAAIGSVFDTLSTTGLIDNTVVIIASDNGADVSSKGAGSNWPLRGTKATVYEGGCRVHAMVHAPKFMDASRHGTTLSGLIHVSDWLPTIVAGIMGQEDAVPEGVDGVNQWDYLTGKVDESRRSEVLYNIDTSEEAINTDVYEGAIRVGKWKLHQGSSPAFEWYPVPTSDTDAIELPTVLACKEHMLFDLESDPHEKMDVSADNADIVARLKARLQELQDSAVPSAYCATADTENAIAAWTANSKVIGPWVDDADVDQYCDYISSTTVATAAAT